MAVDLMQWLSESFANTEQAREQDPKVRLDAFVEFARTKISTARFENFQQAAGNLKMIPAFGSDVSEVWLLPHSEVAPDRDPFVHVFEGRGIQGEQPRGADTAIF